MIRAIPEAKAIIVTAPSKISGNRAAFLVDIPFLGRIPTDPHMAECADAGEPFLEKHPESEVAVGCNLIAEKIVAGSKA